MSEKPNFEDMPEEVRQKAQEIYDALLPFATPSNLVENPLNDLICDKDGIGGEYSNDLGEFRKIADASYWRARAERAEAALASQMDADTALLNVLEERKHQEAKWGEQNHDPYTYLTILMEEVGEYAQACLQTQFGGKHGGLDHMREEAIQTAAVALAIVECLDRGKWQWPHVTKDGEG